MYQQAITYTYRLYRKEIIAMIVTAIGVLMLSLSLVLSPMASAINIGGPSDCDNNAVIRCGAHSTGALISAYNSSAYVRGVFAEFSITQNDMSNLSSTNVAGYVTKSGNVFVDGQSKAVATGAVTGGRQNMPGSTKVNHQGAIFYKRPPSVSFQQNSLPAFVSMKDGRFQFAVIASCGNAVSAQPTSKPKEHVAVAPAKPVSKTKPKQPQPAPAPAVTQSQSQEVNVNNTNVNQNSQTQVNKQEVVSKPAAKPEAKPAAPAPQPTAQASAVQPSTQTVAATLPNTGPTGVIGAFLIAVGLGTFGYRRLLLSRINQ